MKLLDLTLPSPEENLALDEALLDTCEKGPLLRFWEPQEYFVVLGYSRRSASEVHLGTCQSDGIPVLRRYTGGGTVVQGPGCINYSLILNIERSGPLSTIAGTNSMIMTRQRNALQSLTNEPIQILGHTDLAIGNRKFSGNAQRRGSQFLLFHGTCLTSFDIRMVEILLPVPQQQPSYRQNRPHSEFMMNLPTQPHLVKEALVKEWGALNTLEHIPFEQTKKLVRSRYSIREWTFRL